MMTRRGLFTSLVDRVRDMAAEVTAEERRVAVLRERNCLAWQRSFCTVCTERCPEPGVITLKRGRPKIDISGCTGCGVCVDVCPAPLKAIAMVDSRGAS